MIFTRILKRMKDMQGSNFWTYQPKIFESLTVLYMLQLIEITIIKYAIIKF